MPENLAPSEFGAALASLRGHHLRSEVTLTEIPGPTRLSPYAAALNAEVSSPADELIGSGRFVILYDPDGQPAWHGDFRIIIFIKAPMHPEVTYDPLLGEVGWSWLTSALTEQGAGYHHLSGTVTRVLSESFGALTLADSAVEMEVRASLTPVTSDLGPHLQAWLNLVEISCDLVPLPKIISSVGL